MKRWHSLAGIVALSVASCGTPLTEAQKIEGSYYCRATKDRMIFKPDGDYRYSIGGDGTLWNGRYCYGSPPDERMGFQPEALELAKEQYNARGDGLYFTYAVSGHCYVGGKPRWDLPYFPHRDRRELVLISEGKERRYLRQDVKRRGHDD